MLLDLKQDGIRVINILPGRVATDFADEPPQPWHLAAEDVAQVMLDQLALPRRAVVSRVELRPAQGPR